MPQCTAWQIRAGHRAGSLWSSAKSRRRCEASRPARLAVTSGSATVCRGPQPGPTIVGLPIVIPGHNLEILDLVLHCQNLLPAGVPQGFTLEQPVLRVGDFGAKVGADCGKIRVSAADASCRSNKGDTHTKARQVPCTACWRAERRRGTHCRARSSWAGRAGHCSATARRTCRAGDG